MSIKAKLVAGLGVALAPWLFAIPASADETFAVTSVINLPNGQKLGSFDIGFVDAVAGVYVLADRTNKSIDVVDTSSNTVIKQLEPGFAGSTGNNDTSGPDGVLIANHTQVWVGDGNSTVWVLQLHNGHVIAKISTAINGPGTDPTRADELCYDPNDHIILIANDASSPFPFVTFISSTTHAVLGRIVMDGKNGRPNGSGGIEQCQWSPRTGKFYLNVPQANGGSDNLVLQIDPVSERILNTVNVTSTGCTANHGMTIGPSPQIALGCTGTSTSSVIISENFSHNSTTVIATLPDETGTDENWYNPGDNHYFFANSSHSPPQLGAVDAVGEGSGTPVEDASAGSASGSHSVAADPVANQVYVPINNSAAAQATHICSAHGGVDANGCIAVYTTTNDDPGSCFQQGGSEANCPPRQARR